MEVHLCYMSRKDISRSDCFHIIFAGFPWRVTFWCFNLISQKLGPLGEKYYFKLEKSVKLSNFHIKCYFGFKEFLKCKKKKK